MFRRVQATYECEHVGLLTVKGREQPVDAYRLVGPRHSAVARRQAPLVGRGDELALVELLWTNASRGNTHVVSIVGEPGVGKSRLLNEIPKRTDAADFRITCTSGRAFAGRVLQVITGSTGLDDFEWGVSLFAVHPDDLKAVVYQLRFDRASAIYADFGPFYAGMVTPLEDLFTRPS